MAPVCGIDAETLREVARLYARSRASLIFWGMGISQHVHGTDNARCLIALALTTGQIGRPGTGLHPLRGQNNVQGASDAGLIPMVYPDYQSVENPLIRGWFEEFWGTAARPAARAHRGRDHGRGPCGRRSAACTSRARTRRCPTPTSPMPAGRSPPSITSSSRTCSSPRRLFMPTWSCRPRPSRRRPAPSPTPTGACRSPARWSRPPGDARQDWWIIQEIARRLGLAWDYAGPAEVFAEMAQATPSLKHITWERLEREGAVTYPVEEPDGPGSEIIFYAGFPTESGRGAHRAGHASRRRTRCPDAEYPMVLSTGRVLEHWHTGSMTRRSGVLDDLEPEAVAFLSPARARPPRPGARRLRPAGDPPRRGGGEGAGGPGRAGGHGVHAVLLRGGRGEPPHQPGARSVRQDSGVQVLRRAGRAGGGAVAEAAAE